jgi:hypothetical protein
MLGQSRNVVAPDGIHYTAVCALFGTAESGLTAADPKLGTGCKPVQRQDWSCETEVRAPANDAQATRQREASPGAVRLFPTSLEFQ